METDLILVFGLAYALVISIWNSLEIRWLRRDVARLSGHIRTTSSLSLETSKNLRKIQGGRVE